MLLRGAGKILGRGGCVLEVIKVAVDLMTGMGDVRWLNGG
jgi:hypothetical protein